MFFAVKFALFQAKKKKSDLLCHHRAEVITPLNLS
jgi:hypothetical protein